MSIAEMIEKYNLETRGENIFSPRTDIPPREISILRENKGKILSELKERRERKEREKEEEERKEYAPLEAQLPVRKILSENNDEKAQKYIREAEALHFFGREEDDGLDLGISAKKGKLYREAQKYCIHNLHTDIDRTYTADARLLIVRTIECPKCHLFLRDEVSEELRRETILSM